MTDSPAEATRFRVEGMDCAACAARIETAVRRVPGVTDARASFTAGTLNVGHDGSAQRAAIEQAVRHAGYGIAGPAQRPAAGEGDHDDGHLEPGTAPWWRTKKAVLTGITALVMAAAYLCTLAFPAVGHWAFLVALVIGLAPIALQAFRGVVSGTPFSIETLMTIAAVGAVIIGATEEAATVVLLFLAGEMLEGIAARRARASIQGLTKLVPRTALLEENGEIREVDARSLGPGVMIVIRPGDRVPADGRIVEGSSAIDEAPVTGESVPRQKAPGDDVFAGTINMDAVLKVKVTAAAADNTIARIVRLVEEAQESKAPTERFIDRFSRWYTPAVLVVGALVAVVPPLLFGQSWSEWVYKGLATLLIGCPCALVISTPAAIAAGLSNGARRGMLLKGGAVLEELRRVTTVAFDKTGTLTGGKPVVTDIVTRDIGETQALSLAAALESGSNHPLAGAVLARAKQAGAPVPPAAEARAMAGKGVAGRVGGKTVMLVSAQAAAAESMLGEFSSRIDAFNDAGKTVSVLVVDGAAVALIAMRDEPRADARAGLTALGKLGVSTLMLTGDNQRTAAAIAQNLGLEARAGLLPEDKQRIVRDLMDEGHIVAKVGDGINDAPALAAASIGIAMGGGTDVALETADAALLHGRITDIAGMVRLSRAVMGNIAQNITIALGLKAVFLVTTLLGITGLWPAILADTGATVLVTANALRLLRHKG